MTPHTPTPTQHRMTPAEFDDWAIQDENVETSYEFINGEVIEKMVSNPDSSSIAIDIALAIRTHVKKHKLGRVTGADGGYRLGSHRVIPDVGFIRKDRDQPPVKGYIPSTPDLAVEVLSPTDKPRQWIQKINLYIAHGVLVWAVYPAEREIEVYVPGQTVKTLTLNDTLEGGEVLPGFQVSVKEVFAPLFADEDSEQTPTETGE